MNFFADIQKYAEQDKTFLIVFYGASTTSFEYVFPNWGEIIRWVLKDTAEHIVKNYEKVYWNIQTMNLGLDGASSQDLLYRFNKLVLLRKPQMIFLAMGKNDPYYNIDTKITEKNTKKIITQALDDNIQVVFADTVPALWDNLNEKISQHIEVDRKVASDFKNNDNFIFVDLFKLFPRDLLKDSYSLISINGNKVVGIKPGETDPIHYNKLGNAIVAKILLKKVFNIDFNEKKFLADIADNTIKYPEY